MENVGNNIFRLIYELFFILLRFGQTAYDFLFESHTLEIVGFSIEINFFTALVGGGFAVFIIMYLVKTFVPLA